MLADLVGIDLWGYPVGGFQLERNAHMAGRICRGGQGRRHKGINCIVDPVRTVHSTAVIRPPAGWQRLRRRRLQHKGKSPRTRQCHGLIDDIHPVDHLRPLPHNFLGRRVGIGRPAPVVLAIETNPALVVPEPNHRAEIANRHALMTGSTRPAIPECPRLLPQHLQIPCGPEIRTTTIHNQLRRSRQGKLDYQRGHLHRRTGSRRQRHRERQQPVIFQHSAHPSLHRGIGKNTGP